MLLLVVVGQSGALPVEAQVAFAARVVGSPARPLVRLPGFFHPYFSALAAFGCSAVAVARAVI
jgi:hypothetical protein